MRDVLMKRVLVVDDQAACCSMVQQCLSHFGYHCDTAINAEEAMWKLGSQSYDLVVSDIRMPGVDGLQLMKDALARYPEMSFIIMTGHAADYSYGDIIDAGAADYLTKPFDIGELKAKIQRIERERRMLNLLKSSHQALARESQLNASIAELSKALISSVSVEQISQLVLRKAQELTTSPCGFVGQIDPRYGKLFLTAAYDATTPRSNPTTATAGPLPEEALWKWVMSHPLPLLHNTPRNSSPPEALALADMPVERVLAAPVHLENMSVGAIAVANSERDYRNDDLEAMSLLAEIYGVAVKRKWAEQDLEQARDYIEKVFENTADAIGIIDMNGRPRAWNKMASTIFGYTREELQGKNVFDLYADQQQLQTMLAQLRRDGLVSRYDIDMRKKDGTVAPFSLSISLLRGDDGKVMGSVCVARDMSEVRKSLKDTQIANKRLQQEIGERLRIEKELRQAHNEVEQLVTSIPSILIRLSGENHIIWWNETAEKTFGLKRTDMLGRSLAECDIAWSWETVAEGLSRCRRDGTQTRLDDIRFLRADGSHGYLGLGISPIKSEEHENSGLLVLGADITERKILANQLAQAHGLAVIG
jgi:PAS domain S-box-containing protein